MDKKKIKDFFDGLAPEWDQGGAAPDDIIEGILHKAGIKEGVDVLDVGCGTGVLFPFYEKIGVNSITAIDISHVMVDIAREKHCGKKTRVIEGDAENYCFPSCYDCIVIYNAFPHFVDHEKLIKNLSLFLKPQGRLTIAHGMSRKKLEEHHGNVSADVVKKLPADEELKQLLRPYFEVVSFDSDETKIQIVGQKRI